MPVNFVFTLDTVTKSREICCFLGDKRSIEEGELRCDQIKEDYNKIRSICYAWKIDFCFILPLP